MMLSLAMLIMAVAWVIMIVSWLSIQRSTRLMVEASNQLVYWQSAYHQANKNELKTFQLNCKLLDDIKTLETKIHELEQEKEARLKLPPPLPKIESFRVIPNPN